MIRAPSPSPGPAFLPAGNAPPTPPHAAALDDIYGSSPDTSRDDHLDEMLSDLPSRQRNLDTDAYREGLSQAKGAYVQEGFDEGFSLGAEIGLLVGHILGVLHAITAALATPTSNAAQRNEAQALLERARTELRIEGVLGRDWVDDEGIWKWDVEGHAGDDQVTFQEVARHHPLVRTWLAAVEDLAARWRIELDAVDKAREDDAETEQS